MTDNLAAALAAVQAHLPAIVKGETATVPTKAGGKYSYSYADLADVSQVILPLLGKHGLSWITRPTLTDGRFVLAYELLHTSGESRTGEYPLTGGTPQEIGSAITYARRYALCAVTGVAPAADDDDGAAASQRPRPTPESPPPPEQVRESPPPERVRDMIIRRAVRDINAADEPGLDILARRFDENAAAGAITADDAVRLRRMVVARLEELRPAGEQAAIEGDWPEPAKPGQGDPT